MSDFDVSTLCIILFFAAVLAALGWIVFTDRKDDDLE